MEIDKSALTKEMNVSKHLKVPKALFERSKMWKYYGQKIKFWVVVKPFPNKSKTAITIIIPEKVTFSYTYYKRLYVNIYICQFISKYVTYLIKATKLKTRFLKESLWSSFASILNINPLQEERGIKTEKFSMFWNSQENEVIPTDKMRTFNPLVPDVR